MKYKDFNIMQMERLGYKEPTEHEVEIFAKIGPKLYNRLEQCGFNVAYAERCLGLKPQQGSYQRDMIHTQNCVNNLIYRAMCIENGDTSYVKGVLEELTEEVCMEEFKQAIAHARVIERFGER